MLNELFKNEVMVELGSLYNTEIAASAVGLVGRVTHRYICTPPKLTTVLTSATKI